MQIKKVALADTKAFSPFFLDYLQQKDSLSPFYTRYPTLKNFRDQIKDKASFPSSHRKALVETLQHQYQGLPPVEAIQRNISALSDSKTFTVTTGHQLNIFTGPLYFIYKIVTVINTCRELKKAYPDYTFIPVYWMASEDHDYEEIKSFKLYGKKYSWNTEQQGAVGRFSVKDIGGLLNEVPGEIKIFRDAYTKNKTLAAAVRQYVHTLFGTEGLVVVDADDKALKSLLIKVMEEDIFANQVKVQVDQTNTAL